MFPIQTQTIRPKGNGLWPVLDFLKPFYGDVCLGNGTMFRVGMFYTGNGALFVAIERMGAYPFSHTVHPNYAMEKLNLTCLPDAKNISDFINAQLGVSGGKNHGEYDCAFVENENEPA